MDVVRKAVSKEKRRFQEPETGFDLDLTYITDRLIAMGFPSTGVEASYRNPLPEVQRFFESRHRGHYKIYNLCSERQYKIKGSFPLVEEFPFKDHHPCRLSMIGEFCASVDAYLREHPDNVVGVHCKAGKGRTGMLISAYLIHAGVCGSAEDALALFARQRTYDNRGVTIPSQIRYVFYYEQQLMRGVAPAHTYQVTHIRFVTVPNFDVAGGCDPYFTVRFSNDDMHTFDYRLHLRKRKVVKFRTKDRFVILDVSKFNLLIRDDVLFEFFDYDVGSTDDKMFRFWINTAYVQNNYLCLEKSMLDNACKDKQNRHFDPFFKIELFLHQVDTGGGHVSRPSMSSLPPATPAPVLYPQTGDGESDVGSAVSSGVGAGAGAGAGAGVAGDMYA